MEVTTATHIPTTAWPSASVGLELNIRKVAAITLAGGYLGYTNSADTEHGWFYQLGVVGFIDAFGPHHARAAATHAPEPTPPRPTPPPPPPACEEQAPDEPMPDDAPADDDYEP